MEIPYVYTFGRFDLLHVMIDELTEEEDGRIAAHIVALHKNPGATIARAPFTMEQLQRYIKYARAIKPQLSATVSHHRPVALAARYSPSSLAMYAGVHMSDAVMTMQLTGVVPQMRSLNRTLTAAFQQLCLVCIDTCASCLDYSIMSVNSASLKHPLSCMLQAQQALVRSFKRLRGDDAAPGSHSAYRITVRQLEALVRLSEAMARVYLSPVVSGEHVAEVSCKGQGPEG